MWAKIDKVLSDFKDYHVPVILGVFSVGTVIEWYHHLSMPYVYFCMGVLTALTGHAIFFRPVDGQ